nr:hypothetical protein [Corynebacterium lactis]
MTNETTRTQAGSETSTAGGGYSAGTAIGTVFAREIRESLLKKSSLITLIIMIVATVGGIFVADYFMNKSDNEATTLVVVGEAPFADAAAQATEKLADSGAGSSSPAPPSPPCWAAESPASKSRRRLSKKPPATPFPRARPRPRSSPATAPATGA